MPHALIALGGNVGDVRATFQKAISNICGMTQGALLARSSDYATPPWGEVAQERFINACIEIDTSLDPHALLFTLQKIETKFGRDRADLVLAGAAILQAVQELWPCQRVRVADRGLREGLLREMAGEG